MSLLGTILGHAIVVCFIVIGIMAVWPTSPVAAILVMLTGAGAGGAWSHMAIAVPPRLEWPPELRR